MPLDIGAPTGQARYLKQFPLVDFVTRSASRRKEFLRYQLRAKIEA